MSRYLAILLLVIVPLLMGPARQTRVFDPSNANDDVSTVDLEIKGRDNIEVHLDEDECTDDFDGPDTCPGTMTVDQTTGVSGDGYCDDLSMWGSCLPTTDDASSFCIFDGDNTSNGILCVTEADLVDVNGALDVSALIDRQWATPSYDASFGDGVDEGQIRFGADQYIGVADDLISGTNTDDWLVYYNNAAPTCTPTVGQEECISQMFVGSGDVPRFVLTQEGADLATYNPRSLVIGPAATLDNVPENIFCSTNFTNIDCNTSGTGADLGVQDDVEIGGDLWVLGQYSDADGITFLTDSDTAGADAAFTITQGSGEDLFSVDDDGATTTASVGDSATIVSSLTVHASGASGVVFLDLGGDDCTPGPCIADAQITSTNQGDADDITFQMLAQDGGTSRNAFKVDYQSGNDVITVGNDEINAYLFETDNSAGDDLSYDDTNDRWEIGTAEVAVYGTRTLAWQPNEIDEDGTNCVASSNQLNGGPTITTIGCADSSSSVMQGSTIMPDGWDGGTVDLEIFVFHGTTETITFAGDFDAMCRGVGDVVNSTWGTAVAADVSITTANQLESAAATVTPNGTCAAGDQLFWRYTVDDVTFSANAANSEVTGVAMEWARVAGD